MVELLIDKLAQLGISIGLHEQGQLVIHTGKDKLPADILTEIKASKEEIIIYLKEHHQSAGSNSIPVTSPAESYPLSVAQRRLWIAGQFEKSNSAYNIPMIRVFDTQMYPGCLEQALNTLIERHEILRTVFRQNGSGEIRQFIIDAAESALKINLLDLRAEEEQQQMLEAAVREASVKPFDLAEGPLLRASLIRTGENNWVFVLVMHHIISDGWSLNIVIRELLLFYSAHSNGRANPLTPLNIQYKDYSAWQKAQLGDDSSGSHKAYWLKQFEGDLPVLEFPADRVRPAVKTYSGNTYYGHISSELGEGIKALCREQGCTIFMGLLAAVNTLLYRYTRQEDIIIGSPIAGREHPDLENQIGFFVNTLALRTRFKGSDSYSGILHKVREVTLGAFAHQFYPFDELVDELKLHRDVSRNPLVDIQVIVQNAEAADKTGGTEQQDTGIRGYKGAEHRSLVFDMVFIFTEKEDGIHTAIAFNTDMYDEHTAAQLFRHLVLLLTDIINHPYTPVKELDFLSADDRQQLLEEYNSTRMDYPPGKTLVDLFEEQATAKPGNVAVVYGGTRLTYRELNDKANLLAGYLKTTCCIKTEQPVGVMLNRSDNLIVALLGVMKAGGVYVPIDPEYPADRKQYIINDTGIEMLITQSDYIFNLDYYQHGIFAIDIKLNEITAPAGLCTGAADPSGLAYIIYTSGSTGQPKGVMIEHRSIVNTVYSQQTIFGVCETDHGLQFSSASFDASIWEIFMILSVGASLYIIEEADKKDPLLLEKYIADNRIDIATIPPAYLKMLQVEKIASLRQLITAGESAITGKAVSFSEYGLYYNAYGPTESSICATVFRYDSNEHEGVMNIPIGIPIANTRIYIIADDGSLMPQGATGEICIGGVGLARGYWNKPELTAEKFVPNPFAKGERMYKTGDMGRWLPDGNVEFAGRRDDQVKISGHRVELGEIERALQQHESIEAAIVVIQAGNDGEKELAAFVKTRQQINISDLRLCLGRTLPVYMIPHHFIEVESFPLTTSGKIDRKKLQSSSGAAMAAATEYVAPVTDMEKRLVRIWEDVLGKEKVGIKDDYFELGGGSLKAMKIIRQVMDDYGVPLSIKTIFTEKCIENIAAYISSHSAEAVDKTDAGIIKEHAFISEASFNQRIYFSEWNKKSDFPIISMYEYESLDMDILGKALTKLTERHEILRTVYTDTGGKVMQHVLTMEEAVVKIPPVIKAASREEIMIAREKEYAEKFELSAYPLFRIRVYQLPDGTFVVLVTKHHSITDGYSEGILSRELSRLYAAGVLNEPAMLPALAFNYRDYSLWQRHFAASPAGLAHKDYWLRRLEGFSPAVKFAQAPGGNPEEYGSIIIAATAVKDGLYREIDSFAKLHGLTRTTLLMGVLALTINRLNGQDDITLFTAVSGRDSRYYGNFDVSGLVGFFPNMLLIRNLISRQKTVLDYLQGVQDNFADDLRYDTYPFEKLVYELPGIVPAGFLDNTVFFNYHNYSHKQQQEFGQAGSGEERRTMGDFPLRFTMVLSVTEFKNCLNVQFMFNGSFFSLRTREKISEQYFLILSQIIANPGYSISKIFEVSGAGFPAAV
jgi:amino acid adenylation domain-containing protein